MYHLKIIPYTQLSHLANFVKHMQKVGSSYPQAIYILPSITKEERPRDLQLFVKADVFGELI